MAPLTWKNVAAPDFSPASRMIERAVGNWAGAFDGIGGALDYARKAQLANIARMEAEREKNKGSTRTGGGGVRNGGGGRRTGGGRNGEGSLDGPAVDPNAIPDLVTDVVEKPNPIPSIPGNGIANFGITPTPVAANPDVAVAPPPPAKAVPPVPASNPNEVLGAPRPISTVDLNFGTAVDTPTDPRFAKETPNVFGVEPIDKYNNPELPYSMGITDTLTMPSPQETVAPATTRVDAALNAYNPSGPTFNDQPDLANIAGPNPTQLGFNPTEFTPGNLLGQLDAVNARYPNLKPSVAADLANDTLYKNQQQAEAAAKLADSNLETWQKTKETNDSLEAEERNAYHDTIANEVVNANYYNTPNWEELLREDLVEQNFDAKTIIDITGKVRALHEEFGTFANFSEEAPLNAGLVRTAESTLRSYAAQQATVFDPTRIFTVLADANNGPGFGTIMNDIQNTVAEDDENAGTVNENVRSVTNAVNRIVKETGVTQEQAYAVVKDKLQPEWWGSDVELDVNAAIKDIMRAQENDGKDLRGILEERDAIRFYRDDIREIVDERKELRALADYFVSNGDFLKGSEVELQLRENERNYFRAYNQWAEAVGEETVPIPELPTRLLLPQKAASTGPKDEINSENNTSTVNTDVSEEPVDELTDIPNVGNPLRTERDGERLDTLAPPVELTAVPERVIRFGIDDPVAYSWLKSKVNPRDPSSATVEEVTELLGRMSVLDRDVLKSVTISVNEWLDTDEARLFILENPEYKNEPFQAYTKAKFGR